MYVTVSQNHDYKMYSYLVNLIFSTFTHANFCIAYNYYSIILTWSERIMFFIWTLKMYINLAQRISLNYI